MKKLTTRDPVPTIDNAVAWGNIDLATKVYDARQVDAKIGNITGTVAEQIAAAVSTAYKPGGSKSASEITSALLVAANEGKVYNLSEDITTTADFVDGSGKAIAAGTNVVVINNGTAETPSYKFDVLAAPIDGSLVKSVNGNLPVNGVVTIPEATSSASGVMSAAQAEKLDGIAEGAQVNVIETVKVDNVALTVTNKEVNIDLSGKADKSEMAIEAVTGDATKKTITLKTGLSQDVVVAHQDISGKADKDTDAVTGNLAEFDANHNPVDSGKKVSDFALDGHSHAISDVTGLQDALNGKVDEVEGKQLSTEDYTTAEKTKLEGIASGAQANVIETVKVDGTALTPDENKAVNIDLSTPLSSKADKVQNATNGNFAGLDSNGNLTDSGSKAADFATAAQGTKADSAIQSIKLNGSTVTPSASKEVDLGNLKTQQAAVTSPTADGNAVAFIDTISQNANGEIAATKKNIPTVVASTSGTGGSAGLMTPAQAEQLAKLDGDFSKKADKVSGATSGNFAGLDANGNLTDSGAKAADFKTKQTAVVDPTAAGTGVEFIATLTQDTNGVVTATKKTVQAATADQAGLESAAHFSKVEAIEAGAQVNVLEAVKVNGSALTITAKAVDLTLSDAVNSDSSTQFASSKAVKTAKDAADAADSKVSAVNTAAANLLTVLNDTTKVSKAMNTANDIKAVVEALITALKAFADAADNNA